MDSLYSLRWDFRGFLSKATITGMRLGIVTVARNE
jgi:hypothetical protein